MSIKASNTFLKAFCESFLNKIYIFLTVGIIGLFCSGVVTASDLESDEEEINAHVCLPKATMGDIEAQYQLAICYRFGVGGVERNDKEAFKWCQIAALSDDLDAQVLLGSFYERGLGTSRDLNEAFKWYLQAAEKDSLDAQVLVAAYYAGGQGVAQDYSKAGEWYKKAADRKDPQAQYELGSLYAQRKIAVKAGENPDQLAYGFFLKAAEQEHLEGLLKVAECLRKGVGTTQDQKKALYYFSKYKEAEKKEEK